MPRRILAIDPGAVKCGVAVLEPTENAEGCAKILFRSIESLESIGPGLPGWVTEYAVEQVVVGGGTRAELAMALVRSAIPNLPVHIVEETHTTLEARRRYFEAIPPRGWRRWVPLSMQTPPRPYDDFAAVVLGERFLAKLKKNS